MTARKKHLSINELVEILGWLQQQEWQEAYNQLPYFLQTYKKFPTCNSSFADRILFN